MGYHQYQAAVRTIALEDKIHEIRNQPHFTDIDEISDDLSQLVYQILDPVHALLLCALAEQLGGHAADHAAVGEKYVFWL